MSPAIAEQMAQRVLDETTPLRADGTPVPGAVRTFEIHRPARPDGTWTRDGSCLIAFFPKHGICVVGDLARSRRGGGFTITGYGLEWFASKLEEDYFLEKSDVEHLWQPQLAAEWAASHACDPSLPARRATKFKELAACAHDFVGPEGWAAALEGAGYRCDDGVPGYGHAIADAAWLCAIQQTFARLYRADAASAAAPAASIVAQLPGETS